MQNEMILPQDMPEPLSVIRCLMGPVLAIMFALFASQAFDAIPRDKEPLLESWRTLLFVALSFVVIVGVALWMVREDRKTQFDMTEHNNAAVRYLNENK